MTAQPLGLLLVGGTHDRAHTAFMLAAAAAALDRRVILFATGPGCHALATDWSGLENAARDPTIRQRGVAGLAELRAATQALGARLIACEAGLRALSLATETLIDGVEVAGIATFLEAIGQGQVISL